MIIPIHTTPEMAVKEIDELYDVFLDVMLRWKTKVSQGQLNGVGQSSLMCALCI